MALKLHFPRHDIAATCMLKMSLNANHPSIPFSHNAVVSIFPSIHLNDVHSSYRMSQTQTALPCLLYFSKPFMPGGGWD